MILQRQIGFSTREMASASNDDEATATATASSCKRKIGTENLENHKEITKYCFVPQCNNYASGGMGFHGFPKDKNMREAWKTASKMGKHITDFDRVCQDHFLPSDYLPQGKFEP